MAIPLSASNLVISHR